MTPQHPSRNAALAAPLALFLLWALATWWFEGRLHTLLRPSAAAERMTYAWGVNLLLGLAGGVALARWLQARGLWDAATAGWRLRWSTLWCSLAAVSIGAGVYLLLGGAPLASVLAGNVFAQVLVVSAAEVVVCWTLVGAAAEQWLRPRLRGWAVVPAMLLASALFGAYHFAHSPPFDTVAMVLLLSGIGLVTSVFFVATRDVAATILFHNFLALFGVARSLAGSRAVAVLAEWQWHLLGTAAAAALAIAAGYLLLNRRR